MNQAGREPRRSEPADLPDWPDPADVEGRIAEFRRARAAASTEEDREEILRETVGYLDSLGEAAVLYPAARAVLLEIGERAEEELPFLAPTRFEIEAAEREAADLRARLDAATERGFFTNEARRARDEIRAWLDALDPALAILGPVSGLALEVGEAEGVEWALDESAPGAEPLPADEGPGVTRAHEPE